MHIDSWAMGNGQCLDCLDKKCTGKPDTRKSGIEMNGWTGGSGHEV